MHGSERQNVQATFLIDFKLFINENFISIVRDSLNGRNLSKSWSWSPLTEKLQKKLDSTRLYNVIIFILILS